METYYCDLIDVTPLGSFATMFFSNQKFGEVDPNFIREFGHELPVEWRIMDYRFEHHIVTYNKDEIHPLLTDGWKEMREVFDLHKNEEIHFAYHGQVELKRDNIRNPYLVNAITAYCDNGTKTNLQVAIHDNPFPVSALGPGWFGFCRKNGFPAGDELCFNFSLVNSGNNVVRVFKI
ncbi:hypothetical protein L195_g003256 [Trifolium pratense]|uniref:TF-B3 domain-containing protein n=1 Tax=Trifolium pratense TaxID=57577 RepID=A0A2K3NUR3_TRIPR|nr:hypothetical protein L195_g003256 [Trifolium pratense]